MRPFAIPWRMGSDSIRTTGPEASDPTEVTVGRVVPSNESGNERVERRNLRLETLCLWVLLPGET